MADFVKLSIFGTVFEVTTRYVDLQPVGMGAFGLVWWVTSTSLHVRDMLDNVARDQWLMAVPQRINYLELRLPSRKSWNPFRLLYWVRGHIGNWSYSSTCGMKTWIVCCISRLHKLTYRSFRSAISSSLPSRTCKLNSFLGRSPLIRQLFRYWASRYRSPSTPYFSSAREAIHPILPLPNPPRSKIRPLGRCCSPRFEAFKHSRQRELWFEGVSIPHVHLGIMLISRFVISVWHESRILRWLDTFLRDTTERPRLCWHGKSTMSLSISGVQDVSLQRC